MVDFSKRVRLNEQSYVNAYVEEGTIHLLYRDSNGELREKLTEAEYSMYLRSEDVREHGLDRKFRQSEHVKSMHTEGDWLRVCWHNSRVTRKGRDGKPRQVQYRDLMCQDSDSPLMKWKVTTYEGDVHPVRRFMVDNETKIQRPKRLYFDLETDSRVPFSRKEEMRILSFAVTDDDGIEIVEVLEEDTDEAEAKLLRKFWSIANKYDQLIAWNGDRFDFPVIEHRTVLRKIPVNFRRWLWLDHLVLFKRMNVTASESGDEKTSMKLNDVAQAVLHEKKDEFDASKTWEEWLAGGERRAKMARYNMQDTRLLARIEQKTGYIELFFTLCEACGIFPDSRGTNPTQQVDSFLMRLGRKQGIHFRTMLYSDTQQEHEQYKGAMVMEPPEMAGVISGVHVADFARLYPSIIITWNMSPESKRAHVLPPKPIPEGCSRAPITNVTFDVTHDVAILPLALREMIRLRKFWNDKKAACAPGTPEWVDADRRSTAYKIAANSFYGVVGSIFSRYFDRHVGESVTQAGVYLIQRTRDEAERRGWRVIYIDTDSIFVIGCTEEAFREFVAWCNKELYPEIVKQFGCVTNDISLAYEKEFARIVFTGKKRYAGKFSHYKGKRAAKDSKPEIKGLEFKRGDTAKLARQLQEKVITSVITDECDDPNVIQGFIEEMKSYVLTQTIPANECTISKNIAKELSEYKVREKKDGTPVAKPAHLQVAEILRERGMEVGTGTKIAYVVVDGSAAPMKVIPAVDFTGEELDRYYLWENLVWPPTQRFVENAFPNVDWASHSKVRPKKPRKAPVRRSKASPEQPPAPPTGGRTPPAEAKPEARRARRLKPAGVDSRQMELAEAVQKSTATTIERLVERNLFKNHVWVIGAPKGV